jgi:hypothetical protein
MNSEKEKGVLSRKAGDGGGACAKIKLADRENEVSSGL